MKDFFKNNGNAFYFLFSMFVFLFFVYSGSSSRLQFIDSPHFVINTLPLYIVLVLTFCSMCFLFFNHNAQIDFVALLLLFRLFLHLLSLKSGTIPTFYGVNFTTSLLCFCAYLIAINQSENIRNTIVAFEIFFCILVVQIFVEFAMGPTSFFGNVYLYKHDLTLPIGSSNALASKLIPFFAVLYSVSKNKIHRIVLISVTFAGIVLTKSRGGIVDLILFFVVLNSWKGFFSFENSLKFVFFAIFMILLSYRIYGIDEVGNYVFTSSDSSIIGRFDLWQSGLDLISRNLFLGAGFYYGDIAENPHNFIIDILMRSGLVGLFVFFMIFFVIVCRVKNYLTDDFVRGCFVALCCLMWMGLAEIVFFSYIHDVIIWCIAGSMIARVNFLKKQGFLND